MKIAFLAYCSVLRDGQAAGTDKRRRRPAARAYVSLSGGVPAGHAAADHHRADEEDVHAMQEDQEGEAAGRRGDRVAPLGPASRSQDYLHLPAADRARGDRRRADLILGHHAHSIKAVEVYKARSASTASAT